MKVHSSLKELLEDYRKFCMKSNIIMVPNDRVVANTYLSSNSLAFAKSEQLAKNKQGESGFFCSMTYEIQEGIWDKCFEQCGDCKNSKST